MVTLGIDIGSSSIKVSLFDSAGGRSIASAQYPPAEMEILSKLSGWAEQDPHVWTTNLERALELLKGKAHGRFREAEAIGISYQMHGLVAVDKAGQPVRNAIIWCDSRAVAIGDRAFRELGKEYCLKHLLNSPGNFTASKLNWVRENEPATFGRISKVMLPGDYIAWWLTGAVRTTASGLSEGIFWDFERNGVSEEVLRHFGLGRDLLPELVETFGLQGQLKTDLSERMGLKPGIPVTYRAGDQPNNALSLNVLNPGEVAATAGTSGVIYGVTGRKDHDPRSRVNTFLHVNHTAEAPRMGVLLCLNGTGILNSWARRELLGGRLGYDAMNRVAATASAGSEGLLMMPFGNGAERMLENRTVEASMHGLNFNIHSQAHVLRALQEGIAFAMNYGLEIMRGVGVDPHVIRAGNTNMFLSPLFGQILADITGARIELYNTDGAEGAARGAAMGAGHFTSPQEAFHGLKVIRNLVPAHGTALREAYLRWKEQLDRIVRYTDKEP